MPGKKDNAKRRVLSTFVVWVAAILVVDAALVGVVFLIAWLMSGG